eukprot:GHVS01022029.1.p1 GENE.GHVS01022029.1~~GHVS01022029.1.p1  ORF type:complete len:253 (+),score=7.25 GHVS01022029.1:112-870(+)
MLIAKFAASSIDHVLSSRLTNWAADMQNKNTILDIAHKDSEHDKVEMVACKGCVSLQTKTPFGTIQNWENASLVEIQLNGEVLLLSITSHERFVTLLDLYIAIGDEISPSLKVIRTNERRIYGAEYELSGPAAIYEALGNEDKKLIDGFQRTASLALCREQSFLEAVYYFKEDPKLYITYFRNILGTASVWSPSTTKVKNYVKSKGEEGYDIYLHMVTGVRPYRTDVSMWIRVSVNGEGEHKPQSLTVEKVY